MFENIKEQKLLLLQMATLQFYHPQFVLIKSNIIALIKLFF